MTAWRQPIGEPPDDEVAEVRELLPVARASLNIARHDLARARQLAGYGPAAGMTARVLVLTRTAAVEAWEAEVIALEARARAVRLIP